MISLITGWAICSCFGVSSTSRKKRRQAEIERLVTSMIEESAIRIDRTFSFRRDPLHFGQSKTRMKRSSSCLRYSDWVWA